jgi:uncharacterized membrane protein
LPGIEIALGAVFFAAALTPSLIPRTAVTQGVLAGTCLMAGVGLGLLLRSLWHHLELPVPAARIRPVGEVVVALAGLALPLTSLGRVTEWQNAIRARMAMEPVAGVHPATIVAVAAVTATALFALALVFRALSRRLSAGAGRIVPRRVAGFVGVVAAAVLLWTVASGVFFRGAMNALDSSYRELDALIEPERPRPADPMRTGSAASLVGWDDLGRAGREFIASAPTAEALAAATGRPARAPVRVYVGLRAGATARERARLALDELKRVGGFDRSVLVVITPTGTGWVDPAAIDALEHLLGGDVASVAQQYSYLSSPLSLLAEPDHGAEAAGALFREIYATWTGLPREARPRLYLHGLSLGAMNSERSAELFEMIGDPIDGALWSGPPFESRIWRRVTDGRNPGSPAWLPEVGDGRLVRFMNQQGAGAPPDRPWGPMRIVYLQYASDPVTFFDWRDLYRRPAWMDIPRGPDVSPDLGWFPVVTMLQLALDMAMATKPPMGYGHVYAPEHYLEAWRTVTATDDWQPEAFERLKRHLADAARRAVEDPGEGGEDPFDNRGG